MTQSAYSFLGSRLHLVLENEVADAYNRFTDAFFEAQKKHQELHGVQWDPVNEPILLEWQGNDKEIWEKVGAIINSLSELNGGGIDLPEQECTSDYLVKL